MNDLPDLNDDVQHKAVNVDNNDAPLEAEDQELSVTDTQELPANASREESDQIDSGSIVPPEGAQADIQNANVPTISDLNHKKRYEAFVEGLKRFELADDQLLYVVDFMEATLSVTHATPHFKSFWDARTIALGLFKENISPIERVKLWDRYTALSKESRRLKLLFDEQGAFASEQIEIAVCALEKELENPEEALANMPELSFLDVCATLTPQKETYYALQRQLNLLNAQAGRITALRKELIHTEMRVKQKNKFFHRLSAAGDKVFPLRKELIARLSQQFVDDVQAFIQCYFAKETPQDSPFFLREEIKTLQGIAKEFTLNTQAFTRTRMALSDCWDKLKNFEKERKKFRSEQKEIFKGNAERIQSLLNNLAKDLESSEINDTETSHRFEEISAELRRLSLSRDELKGLREEFLNLQKSFQDKIKLEEQQRVSQIQEKEKIRKFKGVELRNAIDSFMLDLDSYDVDSMIAKRDEFLQKIVELPLTKSEKQDLERLLKPVKDAIVDKKEQTLMALSDDDRQAFQQLNEILKQRLAQRSEIKSQLESIRKARGTSSLSIEQAMKYNAQEAQEKERLERVSFGIDEIKHKIATIEDLQKG